MDAVGELLKRISHDYNNLFGIVIATLGILEDDLEQHPGLSQLKPLIEDALSASREGTQLMERLLACTGHHSLDPTPVDVAELLEALSLRLKAGLCENIEFELSVDPELPRAYADRAALESAIANLVENAREAMPAGGRLRIAAAVHGDRAAASGNGAARYLSICVCDDGDGIDPALIDRVLEPFVTSKDPKKSRGFGLSLCYGFARQSGGWLDLESRPGNGTRVTLVLPDAASAQSGAQPDQPPPASADKK